MQQYTYIRDVYFPVIGIFLIEMNKLIYISRGIYMCDYIGDAYSGAS